MCAVDCQAPCPVLRYPATTPCRPLLTLRASPTRCCRLASQPTCWGSAAAAATSTTHTAISATGSDLEASAAQLHMHAGDRCLCVNNVSTSAHTDNTPRSAAHEVAAQQARLALLSSVKDPSVDALLLLLRRSTTGLLLPSAPGCGGAALLPSPSWPPAPAPDEDLLGM